VCSTSVTKIEHPFIGGTFRIEGAGRGRALEEKNFPHPCAVHRRALFICSGDHPHAGVAQPHILCARWTDPSNRFTAPFGITCNGDRALRLRTRAGAAILKSLRHRGRHPRSTDPSPRQAVLFGTQGRAQPRDRRAARHPRTTCSALARSCYRIRHRRCARSIRSVGTFAYGAPSRMRRQCYAAMRRHRKYVFFQCIQRRYRQRHRDVAATSRNGPETDNEDRS
jgi:hypothetical protein